MRYRELGPTGDYVFGGNVPFLRNTPATVAQAIRTRLALIIGSWFLDTRIGLDLSLIMGYGTANTRDFEIQQQILGTQGVTGISDYQSSVIDRAFNVTATVDTIYGQTTITENF